MLKKVSLRWRLTLLVSLLLAVCCIGLSIVLNASAGRMADTIDAMVVQPAQSIGSTMVEDASLQIPAYTATPSVIQAKNSYRIESLVYTVLAVLAGGVFTYYIAGKVLEPVKVLNEQVKNINAHNLDESLAVPQTKDELAELTASFNDMTDKLAQAFLAQQRFSADAAHELRTPLTVLQTKLDVFGKKKVHSTEEYEALTAVFRKQVGRLRSLVAELLEIANMEHELKKEEISLRELFGEVISELSSIAEKKQVSVKESCDELYIQGDYNLLYRAVYNLIENAIKYNISGGSVVIEARSAETRSVIITICDTGMGIPDALKTQIFEPFYRVDKSRSREMGGAGLGLALVDAIVKKHDGTITVSDKDGGGSCFTVMIPVENN